MAQIWRIFLQCKGPELDPWIERIPWRRSWQTIPVFLPEESHGQGSLAGYSTWDHNWSQLGNYTTITYSEFTHIYIHHCHPIICDGYLVYFLVLAAVNNANVSIGRRWRFCFLWIRIQMWNAGPHGSSAFYFFLYTVFHKSYTNLRSHQQCTWVPFSPQSHQQCDLLSFWWSHCDNEGWYFIVFLTSWWLNTFSCTCWQSVCLFQKSACSGPLPYFNRVICCFLLSYMISLYILDISPLSNIWFANSVANFLSLYTLLCGCGGGLVTQSCPTLTFCSFLLCAEAFCLMTSLCSQMTWVNRWRFCAPFLAVDERR